MVVLHSKGCQLYVIGLLALKLNWAVGEWMIYA